MIKKNIIWGFSLAVLAGVILTAQEKEIQPKTQLSELSSLLAENFKLKTQLLQCSVQSSSTQLESEKSKLELRFRKELNAKETDSFDWSTLSFK